MADTRRLGVDPVRGVTRVMASAATVAVHGPDTEGLTAVGIRRLHELEQRWSRFLPGSEITALNEAGGVPCRVSADTLRLVEALVHAWYATGGAFDPTLLGALVGLGYHASVDDQTLRTSLPAGSGWRGDPSGIRVDAAQRVVQLPVGTILDAGGLGKGLAADLVVEELIELGATGVIVEVGGDVAVGGLPVDHDHWTVAIADPDHPGDPTRATCSVALVAGGVATSGTSRRRWTSADGIQLHHLVDPASGRSTSTDVIACTVVAGSCAWAEAFTKTAFVLGATDAVHRLDEAGVAALVTLVDGTTVSSTAWEEFVR